MNNIEQMERLLSISDVCRELGISRNLLNKAMVEGKLPYLTIGKRIKFRRSAIMKRLEELQQCTMSKKREKTQKTSTTISLSNFQMAKDFMSEKVPVQQTM